MSSDWKDFETSSSRYSAGDSVLIGVLHEDGTRETVNATFSDKYVYYKDIGFSEDQLDSFSIEPGDAFLGVEGLAENTQGIDRLAGFLQTPITRFLNVSSLLRSTLLQRCSSHSSCKE